MKPCYPRMASLARATLALTGCLAVALVSACGGRSISIESRDAGATPDRPEPDPDDPTSRAPLELVQKPLSLFSTEAPYRFAKAVARSGGFDLLAGRDVAPRVTLARRATLGADPPKLVLSPNEAEVASTPNAFNAVAVEDALFLCHASYVGDPVLFTSHTGSYTALEVDRPLYDNGFCNGLAFVGETGLVAVTRGRPIRPTLAGIDRSGFRGNEQPAFPDAEPDLAQIALTANAGRFAWAGYLDAVGAVRVAFGSGPAPEQSVDVPGAMIADGRPRIEPWPFDDAIAVSFQESERRARVVAVDAGGTRHLDVTIEPLDATYVSRPELAPTPNGLVVAYSVSRQVDTVIVVELFGRDGQRRAEPHVIGTASALVWSAAALGDVALVVWSGIPSPDDATAFYGALFRTSP